MAIECVHIYPYKQLYFDRGLDLPLRDYSRSQLAITNIEGLGPVDANINITPFAARDGGLFNSSRKQQRNITLTMKLFDDPSMDLVREKVYSACPVGEPISLVFDYSDGYSKTIDGYVENNPVDYFGETEGIQVSILCPDPEFTVIYKGSEGYTISIDYKMVNYPNKQMLVNIGNNIDIQWADRCRDNTELYTINSILNIINKTQKNQEYLFAMAFMLDNDDLINIFYSTPNIFSERVINEYINAPDGSEYENNAYYILQEYGYTLITSKQQFDYLTRIFSRLEHEEDFEIDTFYKKNNLYETEKYIKVSWQADYSDRNTKKYGYAIRYAFLQKNNTIITEANHKFILKNSDFDVYIPNFYYEYTQSQSIGSYRLLTGSNPPEDFYTNDKKYYRKTTNIGNEININYLEDFEQNASYFTSASQLFSILIKKGTPLKFPETFTVGSFYKIKKEYMLLNGHCGYSLVNPSDDLYFLNEKEKYCYADGYFNTNVPLYCIYRVKKYYVPRGEDRDRTQVYYYMDSNGNEISIPTTASTPSDFGLISSKYYRKIEIYDELINYPETDNKIIDGRSRYDVILDYFGYTYDKKISGVSYEPNVFYEYIGDAGPDIDGLYGIITLPLYHLLTDGVPDDWDTASEKYFTRRRRTFEETEYPIYINDHAFYNISDRNLYEYELLFEEPSDWITNYSDYYTIEYDPSLLVGFFTPDQFPDYTKLFSVLNIEPDDFHEEYSNYFTMNRIYSGIFKRIGRTLANVLIEGKSENVLGSFAFLKESEKSNYVFGDSNGMVYYYELKMPYDEYKPDIYYSYDSQNNLYILVTSSDPPEDFYTNMYKYYKKIAKIENYIPSNIVIFYNPYSKTLEYDKDQYQMFLNNFTEWVDHASSNILKIYRSDTANDKYVRKNNFITYKLNDEIIQGELPYLKPGSNYILTSIIRENQLDYNPPRIIAISSIIK